MNIENALKKVENWRRAMIYCCIIFALLTFVFLAPAGYNYVWSAVRFWISLTATIFFALIAVTIKRIQHALTLIYEEVERK